VENHSPDREYGLKKEQAGEFLRPVVRLLDQKLDFENFLRLRAFIAHFDSEFNTLALIQVFESIADDCAEVDENIAFTAITFDKAITFLAVEPFHRTGFFGVSHDLELLSKILMLGPALVPNQDEVFLRNFCHTTSKVECSMNCQSMSTGYKV